MSGENVNERCKIVVSGGRFDQIEKIVQVEDGDTFRVRGSFGHHKCR